MKSCILYFSLLASIVAANPLEVNDAISSPMGKEELKKTLNGIVYATSFVATDVQKFYDKYLNVLQNYINVTINSTREMINSNSFMKNQIDGNFQAITNAMNETNPNDEITKSVGWMAVPIVKKNIDEYLEKVKQTTKNFEEVMKLLVSANQEIDRIKTEIPRLTIN